jgi:hypothetical protein
MKPFEITEIEMLNRRKRKMTREGAMCYYYSVFGMGTKNLMENNF